MKKEFVNPTVKLKATIAQLREENSSLKRASKHREKINLNIISTQIQLIREYKQLLELK